MLRRLLLCGLHHFRLRKKLVIAIPMQSAVIQDVVYRVLALTDSAAFKINVIEPAKPTKAALTEAQNT